MLGLGLGLGLAPTSGGRYDPSAMALFARMSVAPDSTRKGLIDHLVRSLKSSEVWGKLDALYLMAAHDSQAARRNWIADAYNLSAVSAPAFTTDRGFAGNGTSAYLSTGLNPSTLDSGGLAKRDSAHMALWKLTASYSSTKVLAGCRTSTTVFFDFVQTSSTGFVGRPNSGPAGGAITLTAEADMACISRTSSSNVDYYWKGSFVTSRADASVTPPNVSAVILAQNSDVSGVTGFANDQLAFFSIGSSLNSTEQANLRTAVRDYLVAVGAV